MQTSATILVDETFNKLLKLFQIQSEIEFWSAFISSGLPAYLPITFQATKSFLMDLILHSPSKTD